MSLSTHSASSDRFGAVAEHDGGLDHGHDWARNGSMDRRGFPTVCGHARIATPSSAMHDDAHYAH